MASNKEEAGYETVLLEQTLSKIGGLLQIGFGQAGDEIIGQNMGGNGELDPMIPGKKIFAIFGFCDIQKFAHCTEYLQEGKPQADACRTIRVIKAFWYLWVRFVCQS